MKIIIDQRFKTKKLDRDVISGKLVSEIQNLKFWSKCYPNPDKSVRKVVS